MYDVDMNSPRSDRIDAPALDYEPAPEHFKLPPGANFGGVSGIAINSRGHIFVFHRGPGPLMQFDADGRFIQAFGDGLFTRPHGLRIDPEDNIWVTDVGAHFAAKLSPEGRILLILGLDGRVGEWHPYGHLRLLNEPNEVVAGPNGELYVLQGHGKAECAILKFDADGAFIDCWGKTGTGPGEFDVPHSLVIDPEGNLLIADRSNARIQVFNRDGKFIRESPYPGTPCGLCIAPDGKLWLAHGHDGRIFALGNDGAVVGAMGGQGKAPGQFGEAHYIAASTRGEIFVADPLNWRVQKFVPKGG
jgi:sugar lactone lactonase YvrE